MKVNLEPGKYIVAVSGGVDSVVLLDMFTRLGGLELIAFHYEPRNSRRLGRRQKNWFRRYRKIMTCHLNTAKASSVQKSTKQAAREKRYGFLRAVQNKHGAEPIITAHHQDDLLETAIINFLRGTGRRGLDSR